MLALTGRDLDNGRGSRADMAEAVESLKGRVGIAIQRGRLAKPQRMVKIAAVFDQFVSEVPLNESQGSWHPKIALVCYERGGEASSWRLWIGSKNLTKAWNLDFGLVLEAGAQDRHARSVEGVADLGRHLASFCALPGAHPAAVYEQLDGLKWTMPRGVKVRRIVLKRDQLTEVDLPAVGRADRIVLVSPFLDGAFVKRIGTWGDKQTSHVLISTEMAVRKLACQVGSPLTRFANNVYVYDQPEPDSSAPRLAEAPDTALADVVREDEVIPFGLHAKILAVATGRTVRMWVGSANATQRGWGEGNTEVIAELECDVAALDGLNHLEGLGRPVDVDRLRKEPVEPDHLTERLEACRRVLAESLDARLHRDDDRFTLRATYAPTLPDPEVSLRIGLATAETVAWHSGQQDVLLGSISPAEQTGLVRIQLLLAGQSCEWLQKFEIEPGLVAERDRDAIAAHLGPQQFLVWVRAMLNGSSADPDDPNWDDDESDTPDEPDDTNESAHRQTRKAYQFQRITLEEMLSSWSRDPQAFATAQARIDAYAEAVLRTTVPTAAEQVHIEQLRSVWKLLHASLGAH
ncbi:phospholipase D family protein [Trinickia acidisoli]|uniref:phospholipase D family protein n=1 Tax=Trinickia acidisoli TaxID=2767482 RepID=UPI001A90454C|nr:phospholipase D family protein [Trinickia acidisoli]